MPLTQETGETEAVQPPQAPEYGSKPDESASAPAMETGGAETPAAEIAIPDGPAAETPPIEPVPPPVEAEPEVHTEPPQPVTELSQPEAPIEAPPAPVEQSPAGQAAPAAENYLDTARAILRDLISRHSIKAVALGSSTSSRSVEDLVRRVLADEKIEGILITEVNDAGVAIYSSSRIAREELPEHGIVTRCAISLARRLQDPLAELVKVDPKLIGVGQYQHDVDQKELHRSLVQTVRSCVNSVGLDLNAAGFPLLRYASGLNDKLARKIIAARAAAPFTSRTSLLQVPGIDAQVFEQAAGFLRVRQGENPLDATAVHPESYPLVEKMAAALGVGVAELIGNRELVSKLKLEDFVTEAAGLPTLHDIREELLRPGRDPRRTFKMARFREDVKQITDLREGMTLEGTVTNVTNFGAFVDVGVHQDGLVHLSQISNRFVRDPREAVKVGDVVQVKVISVETETKRIGLSIKALLPPPARRRKRPKNRVAPTGSPRGAPRRPVAVTAPVQAASAGDPAAATDVPAPSGTDHPPARREPRRPQGSGRREPGRRDRERHHHRRREEHRPEQPAQQQEQPPPEPAVPEPTLQEKIAILQSKFRGIN
jgi:predicted RNA-binding protein with RPS1 domain